MLLRFSIENFGSFKDAVEFNTFPSSKSHRHDHHKKSCAHATALQQTAIYGANGAGKSNLIVAIKFLCDLVSTGSLKNMNIFDDLFFCLDPKYRNMHSGLAIEFYADGKIFYYQLEFDKHRVYSETLLQSKRTVDTTIFARTDNEISIGDKAINEGVKRMLRSDMLLLSFLGEFYPEISDNITIAYHWICNNVEVVMPNDISRSIAHMLDTMPDFVEMANSTLPQLNKSISKLDVKSEVIDENAIKDNENLLKACEEAKRNPETPCIVKNVFDDSSINVIYHDGILYKKTLVCIHRDVNDNIVEMAPHMESDGTRRMIEYLPLFYMVLKSGKTIIVDEIERSMHPILIKGLVRKLSESENVKGQLIFSTHESGLLDQEIFRPDEIWMIEQDSLQASQAYPLSDFNIHATANIENGYLNGRYGAIPFLSNLKDLHW